MWILVRWCRGWWVWIFDVVWYVCGIWWDYRVWVMFVCWMWNRNVWDWFG